MVRIYLSLLLAATALTGWTQQRPQYTQYLSDHLLLNPAVAGIEDYIDVKATYRKQWAGLDGAPETSALSISAPIGTATGDAAAMSGGSADPYRTDYRDTYQAAEAHHGLGFTLVSDKIGYTAVSAIDATYAYHLGLSSRTNLALGVSAGIAGQDINTAQILLADPTDAAVSNLAASSWHPDLGIGLWLYASDYYLGLSAMQLIPTRPSAHSATSSSTSGVTAANFFATAGFKTFLADDIALVPSILVKAAPNLPLSFDLDGRIIFDSKFWVGGAYRSQDSFAGHFGIYLSSFLTVSYAYDYATSALREGNFNTHEIGIALLLNNKYKVSCPQRSF